MSANDADMLSSFRQRLAEAIAWCGEPAANLYSWHTPALRPRKVDDGGVEMGDTPRERFELVEALASARRDLLYAVPAQRQLDVEIQLADLVPTGRLLAFDRDHSLSDGAALVATQGFFDSYNTPAWDTWIWFVAGPEQNGFHPFDSYLLSWVPQELIDVVSLGIDVNPEECILWATDLDRPFIRRLKESGLLH